MRFKTVPMIEEPLSVIGFGTWASGGDWEGAEDDASVETIRRAVDLGINFFDVAPVYGLGHAERILGRALTGRREEVLIATKCGLVWDQQNRVTNDASAASLPTQVEESLRRLGTDVIDLLQIHWPDPSTPIAETMGALVRLRDDGKIRYIGVSNFSLDQTREAMAHGPVASFQGLYNLLEHNPTHYHEIPLDYRVADEILPFCARHGLAFLPYSPLFQGLLTDEFDPQGLDDGDVRTGNPHLRGERLARYLTLRDALLTLAQRLGRPLSQLAINWLVEQPAVTSVIAGAIRPEQVEQNVGSLDWTLTSEIQREIDAILAPHTASGFLE